MNAPAPTSVTAPFYQAQGEECRLFEAASQQQLPVLIKGPTGCGKTRFVAHMAARLGLPLITVSCHDDLSAADLVGRHLIGDGQTIWCDGPLTRAVRQGGICYLDEVVEARKDTTVVLHPLTDDRRILPIERTGELLEAPPSFMLVVSYNPGYQHVLKTLKPSTRQRFVAMTFDFPSPEVELTVLMQETGISETRARQLVTLAGQLRRLTGYDLDESVSTRLLVYAAKLMMSGMSPRLACHTALAEPLSDEADTIAALLAVIDTQFPL
ncbi:CbbQ/NirQ/NorQ/GpvN family protein [Paludibacterium denitrificans]|uniref:AAA domain-containing protein n=1 Tax=Paludibacterium denitrificans TaxID=2675226 RepID=A0A844G9H7_9NEIS|nr:CbbQ/NirQ/NorQ/GpvN family protein [Paludibacterium denitrificans]MTD32289.1 AAA domain-containing protein [Paludibacterium denitrificans]